MGGALGELLWEHFVRIWDDKKQEIPFCAHSCSGPVSSMLPSLFFPRPCERVHLGDCRLEQMRASCALSLGVWRCTNAGAVDDGSDLSSPAPFSPGPPPTSMLGT